MKASGNVLNPAGAAILVHVGARSSRHWDKTIVQRLYKVRATSSQMASRLTKSALKSPAMKALPNKQKILHKV